MRLLSIQVGKPRTLDAAAGGGGPPRPWRTGYGKARVEGPVHLGLVNLDGDGQADKRHHGGPEMAVLAYSASHYAQWRGELAMPELPHGAFAENLTVEGADEQSVCLGDSWRLGEAELQVSQPRKPCNNISKFWGRAELLQRVIDTGRFGWYLRVLRQGRIEAGQPIELLARPHPEWTVARAMEVRLGRAQDPPRPGRSPPCPSWARTGAATCARALRASGAAQSARRVTPPRRAS